MEEIYEEEDGKQINNFENITSSSGFGNNIQGNYYCNVPEFLLENQRDYIEILKKENQRLQEELNALKKK